MATLKVYEPAMCCSTGVCGPSVDPVLARFASDLAWAESQGVGISRYNLGQSPEAFVAEPRVLELMQDSMANLPIFILDEELVSYGEYPNRQTLGGWLQLEVRPPLRGLKMADRT